LRETGAELQIQQDGTGGTGTAVTAAELQIQQDGVCKFFL